ncbi:MAG: hypothetical protein ACFCUS_10860 [Rubrimonas sp.]|uniref:hypothetical protein n=1 Tax=Rubrimonas sp. TaxID=2036015 RepID=UPI002FDD6CA0
MRGFRLLAPLWLSLALGAGAPAQAQAPGSTAQLHMRIDALETEIRRLTAELERLGHALRQAEAANRARFDDFEFRVTELEGGDPTAALRGDPGDAPPPAAPQGGGAAPQTAPERAPERAVGEPPAALGVLREPAPRPAGAGEQADFDAAMRDLDALGLEAGGRSVDDFLARHPQGALAGRARLALGGAYAEEGRFAEATRELVAGLRADGDGPSGPPTLLLLAETLHALGRTADACAAFAEFDARYPDAPADVAGEARRSAQRLGCR